MELLNKLYVVFVGPSWNHYKTFHFLINAKAYLISYTLQNLDNDLNCFIREYTYIDGVLCKTNLIWSIDKQHPDLIRDPHKAIIYPS